MIDFDIKNLGDLPIKFKILIIIVPCFLLSYFAYMIDFSGQQRKITSIQKQIDDIKPQVQSLLNQVADLNGELSQLPTIKKIISSWQNRLVAHASIPDLLNDIIKLGTANQLQFILFSPNVEVKEGDYYKVVINTIVSGNYNQIANFFSQISNMHLLVEIENFTLSKDTKLPDKKIDEAAASRITGKITFQVYYLAEQSKK